MALLHEDDGAFAMHPDFRTTEIKGRHRELQNQSGWRSSGALGGGGSPSASIIVRDSAGGGARGSEEGGGRTDGRKATGFFVTSGIGG
jgi:hypothetical protein